MPEVPALIMKDAPEGAAPLCAYAVGENTFIPKQLGRYFALAGWYAPWSGILAAVKQPLPKREVPRSASMSADVQGTTVVASPPPLRCRPPFCSVPSAHPKPKPNSNVSMFPELGLSIFVHFCNKLYKPCDFQFRFVVHLR